MEPDYIHGINYFTDQLQKQVPVIDTYHRFLTDIPMPDLTVEQKIRMRDLMLDLRTDIYLLAESVRKMNDQMDHRPWWKKLFHK